MENKKYDAVKLVRSIRDKNYVQTKGYSHEELVKWFNENNHEALKYINGIKNTSKTSSTG